MSDYMAAKMDDQIEGAISENERLRLRIEALEAALRQARAALVYHTEQTRPIGATEVALAAINDLLKD